ARSVAGRAKNSSGGACSMIRPPSMNTTRLAECRAKPISWVTTTIVMPSRASPFITSRTSLIISGSRADVGSSKRITFGLMPRARRAEDHHHLAPLDLEVDVDEHVERPEMLVDPLQHHQRCGSCHPAILRAGQVKLPSVRRFDLLPGDAEKEEDGVEVGHGER